MQLIDYLSSDTFVVKFIWDLQIILLFKGKQKMIDREHSLTLVPCLSLV